MSELALQLIAENKKTKAKSLDLGRCGLTEVPLEIGELVWLEELNFSNEWHEENQPIKSKNTGLNNKIDHLPESFFLLKNLKKLRIAGNYREKYDFNSLRGMENLINLETLDFSNTKVSSLLGITKLLNLREIKFGRTDIKNISKIKSLIKLQKIKFDNTNVEDISPLSSLFDLKEISLHGTKINDITSLSKLTNLKNLTLSFTDVHNLQPLYNLTNLQKIILSSTKINDLSPLSNLLNLKILWINHTLINDISPLYNLKNLSGLGSADIAMTDLDQFSKLTNLRTLVCSDMEIDDLSPLSNLINLRRLVCGKTSVNDISPLSKLINLEELILFDTPIADISPLSSLINLRQIDFSDTSVSNLSSLKSLVSLQELNCRNTYIKDLRPLSGLINLKIINCSKTKVKDLTPILPLIKGGIPTGWWLAEGEGIKLYDCPLTTPPPEIVQQGNAAILRYFDEREKSGTDQIYEAKLLLIGEGGAGKTTLCRKLFDTDAQLPKEEETTRGIDIRPLYFDIPDGKKFRLNVWDFAGQGKYQSAHSFFYTHRSLYVLVDDTRTLDENEAYRTFYNHWLQTAELFGGNSPLLVLHNQKADRVRTGFNLGSFQATFPFVKDLFQINLGGNDTAGIQDLKNQIERWAQKLPHIGDVVPKTWVKVREDIENERQARPYISDERYREICAAHGIHDELKQSDLSHYFHDLGVILHFQANPLLRRDVFLQNQWVTDAVYKVLDDADIAGMKRGRFDKTDLARLWNEGLYAKRRDELLALMLQFELCYQVQDTETYVAPQLLPGDVPPYDLGTDIPLQLKYEYGFMPKGLLYRLIVRLHRHIAQQQSAVWNSGVVLERAGAQADILESLDRRQIAVRATGARAKELVTIINEEVERLHASYSDRLKVEVKIPCNCDVCKVSQTPHFYDKKDLDNRLAKKKPTVECKESFGNVQVQGLLDGVFTEVVEDIPPTKQKSKPTISKQMENQPIQQPVRVYISFSHKDMDYREKLRESLQRLEASGLIKVWSDHLIMPGENWEEVMKKELNEMDLWVVLVSPDSLNSTKIWDMEYTVAQKRKVPIIPILLRPADLTGAPIEGLQLLPSWGKAISRWDDQDEAFLDITKGIRKAVEHRLSKAPKKEVTADSATPSNPVPAPATPPLTAPIPSPSTAHPRTIKIFLASSEELRKDRDDFDLYFRQQNDHLLEEKGLYLKIVRWENFLDAMSDTRLQDEYNQSVQACDIFVSLFFTKTGKYTREEFNVAHEQFKNTRKPQIFTFFKDEMVKPSQLKEFQTVERFKKKLLKLGHFHTSYDNIEHLKRQFRDQLDKLLREGKV